MKIKNIKIETEFEKFVIKQLIRINDWLMGLSVVIIILFLLVLSNIT